MRVNGTNTMGAAQAGSAGINAMQTDSYTKNIQAQIANAQQKLQELSSNNELSLEEKMKKRQEIQKEITSLNQQLRQHQMELRREQQKQAASMDDMMPSGAKENGNEQEAGLSQSGMKAMISADSAIKQADVRGSVAAKMKGKARVLSSEIEQDAARGANTEKKQEELASIQQKAQNAEASQAVVLAKASQGLQNAAKEDQNASDGQEETTTSQGEQTTEQTAESFVIPYQRIDVRL